MLTKNRDKWKNRVKIFAINLDSEEKDAGKAAQLKIEKKWDSI